MRIHSAGREKIWLLHASLMRLTENQGRDARNAGASIEVSWLKAVRLLPCMAQSPHLGSQCLNFKENKALVLVTNFTNSLPARLYHTQPCILLSWPLRIDFPPWFALVLMLDVLMRPQKKWRQSLTWGLLPLEHLVPGLSFPRLRCQE